MKTTVTCSQGSPSEVALKQKGMAVCDNLPFHHRNSGHYKGVGLCFNLGTLSLRTAQIARATVMQLPIVTTELCQGRLRTIATTSQANAKMITAVARMPFSFRLIVDPPALV